MGKMTASAASEYYHEKDPIFKEDGVTNGTNIGTGSEKMGIAGKADYSQFIALLNGYSPDGSTQLVGKGKEGTDKDHSLNACTDYVLSVPKSFSLAMLEDREFRKDVMDALQGVARGMEQHVYGRAFNSESGKVEQVKAGMVATTFEHSISRPTKENPISDVGFHLHVVIQNLVQRNDGSFCALENREIMKNQMSTQQDAYSQIARIAKEHGYDIELRKGAGSVIPEIAGIGKEIRDVFSKRQSEIKADSPLKDQLKESLPFATTAQIESLVAAKGRLGKDEHLTEAKIVDSHREQASIIGVNLTQLVQEAKTLGRSNEPALTARDYVSIAIKDKVESESVFSKDQVIKEAVKLSTGDCIKSEIEKAWGEAVKSKEVTMLSKNNFSTPEQIKLESGIAKQVVAEANIFKPIMSQEQTQNAIMNFEANKGWETTKGQRESIELVLNGTSRLSVISGDAGSGKSTSFSAIFQATKDIPGFKIQGLGFQGKAAAELQKSSGIVSQTIDSYLMKPADKDEVALAKDGQRHQLLVVDEASMLSSKQLGGLLERAEQIGASMVLVGDVKQIAAIGSGKLMKDLMENKLVQVAHMPEIRRQKLYDENGKQLGYDQRSEAVNLYAADMATHLKNHDVESAFQVLDQAGKITEISDRTERINHVSKMYADRNDQNNTVVMCITNADRKDMLSQIRELQKESGTIGKTDFSYQTKDPVNLSGTEKRMTYSYPDGNYVTLTKDIGALKSGSTIRIAGTDQKTQELKFDLNDPDNKIKFNEADKSNMAILQDKMDKGEMATINLMTQGEKLSQFQYVETKISIGEKLIYLANDNSKGEGGGQDLGIKNGLSGIVQGVDEQTGVVILLLENGKTANRHLDGEAITHGACISVNKAQGISAECCIAMSPSDGVGSLLQEKTNYVEMTRHEREFILVTDNKEQLMENVSRDIDKTSTLDHQPELLASLKEQVEKTYSELQAQVVIEQALDISAPDKQGEGLTTTDEHAKTSTEIHSDRTDKTHEFDSPEREHISHAEDTADRTESVRGIEPDQENDKDNGYELER